MRLLLGGLLAAVCLPALAIAGVPVAPFPSARGWPVAIDVGAGAAEPSAPILLAQSGGNFGMGPSPALTGNFGVGVGGYLGPNGLRYPGPRLPADDLHRLLLDPEVTTPRQEWLQDLPITVPHIVDRGLIENGPRIWQIPRGRLAPGFTPPAFDIQFRGADIRRLEDVRRRVEAIGLAPGVADQIAKRYSVPVEREATVQWEMVNETVTTLGEVKRAEEEVPASVLTFMAQRRLGDDGLVVLQDKIVDGQAPDQAEQRLIDLLRTVVPGWGPGMLAPVAPGGQQPGWLYNVGPGTGIDGPGTGNDGGIPPAASGVDPPNHASVASGPSNAPAPAETPLGPRVRPPVDDQFADAGPVLAAWPATVAADDARTPPAYPRPETDENPQVPDFVFGDLPEDEAFLRSLNDDNVIDVTTGRLKIPFWRAGFPEVVLVDTGDAEGMNVCTGTIIRGGFVLTASHCAPEGKFVRDGEILGAVFLVPRNKLSCLSLPLVEGEAYVHPAKRCRLARLGIGLPSTPSPNIVDGQRLILIPILSRADLPPAADISGVYDARSALVTLAGFGKSSILAANDPGPLQVTWTSARAGSGRGLGAAEYQVVRSLPGRPGAACVGDSGGPAFRGRLFGYYGPDKSEVHDLLGVVVSGARFDQTCSFEASSTIRSTLISVQGTQVLNWLCAITGRDGPSICAAQNNP